MKVADQFEAHSYSGLLVGLVAVFLEPHSKNGLPYGSVADHFESRS